MVIDGEVQEKERVEEERGIVHNLLIVSILFSISSQLLYIVALRNGKLLIGQLRKQLTLTTLLPSLNRQVFAEERARIETDSSQLQLA